MCGMLLWAVASTSAAAEVAMFSQRNFQGARYSLSTESANMNFSPRSIRVVPGEPWQICPRPFFGGDCRTIEKPNAKLTLPRSFSGMVRSARPLAAPGAAPATPVPPVVQTPPPVAKAPAEPPKAEPVKPEPPKPEPAKPEPAKPEPKAAEPKTAGDAPANAGADAAKPDA